MKKMSMKKYQMIMRMMKSIKLLIVQSIEKRKLVHCLEIKSKTSYLFQIILMKKVQGVLESGMSKMAYPYGYQMLIRMMKQYQMMTRILGV